MLCLHSFLAWLRKFGQSTQCARAIESSDWLKRLYTQPFPIFPRGSGPREENVRDSTWSHKASSGTDPR